MSNDTVWKTKLATRILDMIGQDGETLDQHLDSLIKDVDDNLIKRANSWAVAADHPMCSSEGWTKESWAERPVLIHPLSGEQLNINEQTGFVSEEFKDIKAHCFKHILGLLQEHHIATREADLKRALLTFWRFGSEQIEVDGDQFNPLWGMLPNDSRIPDHSIWEHLDLCAAFAGAFSADSDNKIALMALSIGPVQPFIAASRSTSDLWAGSHILSRLAWETMRPLCEQLGPDAILFPRLRGVPQVDLWLRDHMELPGKLFEKCTWMSSSDDGNPLYSAALPNRFVAVVPASQAKEMAEKAEKTVREWLQGIGKEVVESLLEKANCQDGDSIPAYSQMKEQLAGFPEVHWAVVPFSMDEQDEKNSDFYGFQLSQAMQPFFKGQSGEAPGFLGTTAWKTLQKAGKDHKFFALNPGMLYTAIYDLAERVLAAAKSVRPYKQTCQQGWRCSLTGENEWLTTDKSQLSKSYRRQDDTLWAKVAKVKPSWAKKGEHLSALPAIKRLWPTIFAEEVRKAQSQSGGAEQRQDSRFVVSTHAMALAPQLDQWLEGGGLTVEGTAKLLETSEPVALPRRLLKRHKDNPALDDARLIPTLLEKLENLDDDYLPTQKELIRNTLGHDNKIDLESYYALLLMDGDRMGQILSGDPQWAISYSDSFHPQVRDGFLQAANQASLSDYANMKRTLSPNRHFAISSALNDFSLTVVRHVIEEEHLGRVIYAGGDDVMAMLPTADVFSAMPRLRKAYSGEGDSGEKFDLNHPDKLFLSNGFACINGKTMRMMGRSATASCGVVVAHQKAPLAMVRRELESAEKRAKNEGGRDAFSITVIKRSGGALHLTAKWGEPVSLIADLCDFLAAEDTSRRAVFHTLNWLHDLPEPSVENRTMLDSLFGYQLARQANRPEQKTIAKNIAPRLTGQLLEQPPENRLNWLANFLSVAEFFARETRYTSKGGKK